MVVRPANYQSAKQQVANLRYERADSLQAKKRRKNLCAKNADAVSAATT
jgi:hypothetical protein